MIDIHHHLLYGLDDGARSEAVSRSMADRAERQGVRFIIATAHARSDVRPFDRATYDARLAQINAYCESMEYALRVLPGAEVLYSEAAIRSLDRGEIPTMNGTRFVLVEWSDSADSALIFRAIREMSNAGYRVIIAHIERYRALWTRLKQIEELKATFDLRIQIDCDALIGRGHFLRRRFVHALIERGLVDYVASDAHGNAHRSIRMNEVRRYLKKTYGNRCAHRLTEGNQRELLEKSGGE